MGEFRLIVKTIFVAFISYHCKAALKQGDNEGDLT